MTVKTYEIRVNGTLNQLISDSFEWLHIRPLGENDYILTAWLVDQPALHGLLDRIYAEGLVLISVHCLSDSSSETSQVKG